MQWLTTQRLRAPKRPREAEDRICKAWNNEQLRIGDEIKGTGAAASGAGGQRAHPNQWKPTGILRLAFRSVGKSVADANGTGGASDQLQPLIVTACVHQLAQEKSSIPLCGILLSLA